MKTLRPQKIKTTVENLKVFHSGKKIRLMFQDEAGFGRINKPKYCWGCGPGVKFCVSVFRQSQEWDWKAGQILA